MAIPDTVAAFLGLTTDHLYTNCPHLVRMVDNPDNAGYHWLGDRAIGEVDPLGTDICGWCQRVWMARNCPGDDTDGGT